MIPENMDKLSIAAGTVVAYLALVRFLRYRRINSSTKKMGYTTPESLDNLTLDDAWKITQQMGQMEFPYTYKTALEFALFRTYAIPTISSLLQSTTQFAHPINSHRRLADTQVLISEMVANPIDSHRANTAIRRLNFLHGRHGDKISNDDLLFTLGLFICQPVKFIDEWEWRGTTELERRSIHMFWSELGRRMGIKDIPGSYEEMRDWAEEYEEKYMVPAESNHNVAEYTTNLLLYFAPSWIENLARDLIIAVLDTRLRVAMLYPPPPSYAVYTYKSVIAVRRFMMKYLALPRIIPFRTTQKKAIDESVEDDEKRYFFNIWGSYPWYIKDNWWNRWGPFAVMMRMMGKEVPRGNVFNGGKGYSINEIGPKGLERVGPGHEHHRVKKNGNGSAAATENGDVVENGGEVGGTGKCPVAFGGGL